MQYLAMHDFKDVLWTSYVRLIQVLGNGINYVIGSFELAFCLN